VMKYLVLQPSGVIKMKFRCFFQVFKTSRTTSLPSTGGVPVRTGIRAGVVGRPLTPVSVAGVSRRATRRTMYRHGY